MNKSLHPIKALLFVLCAFATTVAFGQTKITGTVSDEESNEKLIGAYVVPVNSNGGAITDDLGNFNLTVPAGVKSIKISFVGYDDQTLLLGTKTRFDVKMASADKLGEVIVIAYGTQKKSDKTGAVTQVTSEELNKGRITDPIQGMQGKAAGVNVSKQGGDPNKGFTVNIRSSGSLTGSTDPLYVVDGVVGIDPTTLNPDDIASFNILKDAASTSLYGTQGANGVVIITTKGSGVKGRGRIQPMKVEYNGFVSFDKVANRLDFLSGDEIRQWAKDVNSTSFQDGGANTDWLDEIYTTGISQQHTFAVSQGTESGSFRASLSSNNLQGVLKGTSKDRYIARLNLNQMALDDKLTMNFRMSGTFEKNDYVKYDDGSAPDNAIYQAMRRSPTDPVYNPDGSYYESDRSFEYNNPVAIIEQFEDNRDAKRLLANAKLSYEIIDGLSFTINGAVSRDDDQYLKFQPRASFANQSNGSGERGYNNKAYNYIDEVISYTKTIKDIHSLNVIGGHSYQVTKKNGFSAYAEDAYSDVIGANNLETFNEVEYGYVKSYSNADEGLASFFSRAIYDYDKKYYTTLSLRRDKSSKYGDNKEWGTFFAVSTAWNMKKEKFLKDNSKVSDLRLRIGYGTTGNTNIPNGIDNVSYTPNGQAIDPETGETVLLLGNVQDIQENPDLGWERLGEFNVGIDYGFLKNRFSGSIEFYKKKTTDLVAAKTQDVPPNRNRNIYANLGQIDNQGIEVSFNANVINKKNLSWKTTLVASRNVQETITLGDIEADAEGLRRLYISGRGLVGGDNYTQLIKPGQPIGSFYLPVYVATSADGKFLFETESGGFTRDPQKAKRQFVGSAQPDVILGWSNYFEIWKGFDASFSLRGIFGHQIYNVTKMVFSNPSDAPTLNVLQSAIEERDAGLTSQPTVSTYYLEDGDFIKLDNFSLGYNFDLKKENRVKRLRLYANANNLWMWTKYSGLDPELNFSGSEFGRDQYDVYPRTRSLTFGVNLSL
jgi:iron complex outermembrane receptor protein